MTDKIVSYLNTIKNVKGDWAEVGIFKGNTFKQLLPMAKKQGRYLYGIDSFKGMAKPTEDDAGKYPQGKLNNGGDKFYKELVDQIKSYEGYYKLIPKFVPEAFNDIHADATFSFCYVDLDQYLPTKQTIDFMWSKINKNGLILFDDYVLRYNILATKAIKEFIWNNNDLLIIEKGIQLISGGCKSQILIRKI